MNSVGSLKARLPRALLYGALVPTSLVILVLAKQNAGLQHEVRRLTREIKVPHAGDVVPTFRSATLAGDTVTVADVGPGGRQLLLVFTTDCPYCLKTLPYWHTIAQRGLQSGSSFSVYGISLDSIASTRRYVSTHEIAFPVVRFPDARTAGIYKAIGVPLTIVVGENGEVLYGRAGELSDRSAVDSVLAVVGAT